MTENCEIQLYVLVSVFCVCCPVYSILSNSFRFLTIPGCNDKLGNDDLFSMEETRSLIECAVMCRPDCFCFGYHPDRKLCRRLARCDPPRMKQIQTGWLYFLPSRDCNTGWKCNNYTGRCYLRDTAKLSQAEAMQICKMCNSYLVEINDLDENIWIIGNLLADVSCINPYDCTTWTGGNDKDTEGVYVWEHSNTPIGFTKWSPINPDNYFAPEREIDCIDMFYNGEWNDRPCTNLNGFICERENL